MAAWVVLTHNTRLGAEFGDVAVVNCFGDRYPYALCPSWPEVHEYAATLAEEAAAGADEVSLEACGRLGLTHLSRHEKTDGAFSPAAASPRPPRRTWRPCWSRRGRPTPRPPTWWRGPPAPAGPWTRT